MRDRSQWIALSAAAALLAAVCLVAGLNGPVGAHSFIVPACGHITLYVLMWALSVAFMLALPRGLGPRKTLAVIMVTATVCRMAFLPLPPSDDVNRYLWEGRLLAHGVSPYVHAPDDPCLAPLARDDPYHAGVNHPEMPAAYPPLALSVFALLSQLAYTPLAVKILMIAFDLGTLCLLHALLCRRRLAPQWSVLYALNPLVLYSFAGHAHFDALQNFFLLAALLCYERRRWAWMFLWAGLAVQSKYVAVCALPFLLRRDNWRYAWIGIAAALLPFLPVSLTDPRNVFWCLFEFGGRFAFNGCVHAVLLSVLGSIPAAAAITRVIFIGCVLLALWRMHPAINPRYRDDPLSGATFVLGALLVLSPTVHFWYLTWILPLVLLRPSAPWIALTLTSAAYFPVIGVQYMTGEWRLPLAAQLLEWTPFCLLLARDGYLAYCRSRAPFDTAPASSVSVIVPTRNECATIADCVAAARTDPAVREVIVVDAGSSDDTVNRAGAAGAEVLVHTAPPETGGGRGGQIAAGLAKATGDVVAIVHADTMVPAPAFSRICHVLAADRAVVGGAFGSVFDARHWWVRMLGPANDFRAALLGLPFGDQVQFFRRRPVSEAQAFPGIPLMEDVELALRLDRLGRRAFLFGSARVSARHWRHRKLARAWLIVRLLGTYLLTRLLGRADPHRLYLRYYRPDAGRTAL